MDLKKHTLTYMECIDTDFWGNPTQKPRPIKEQIVFPSELLEKIGSEFELELAGIVIKFQRGVPMEINGDRITSLDTLAGKLTYKEGEWTLDKPTARPDTTGDGVDLG
jgi:hypothetical protein